MLFVQVGHLIQTTINFHTNFATNDNKKFEIY
ncbi:hypothetical protein VQ7734_01710 [Vibrio quintilis]|uniref:Uncharacterized protein n=1 Tax=Vibrio quintilis TaxID=1117707 RepID=A0A1M7YTM2_9VIBR|nr:hypothetical protein VQ7734_01710 [Vibrio quintilis]